MHRVDGRCRTRDEMLLLRTEGGKRVFRLSSTKDGEIWLGGEARQLKPAYLVRD